MSERKSRIEQELDNLRTLRDELRVQVHLGRAEVRELWEGAEKRWQKLEGELDRVRDEAREPLEQIGEAAELLLGEIRSGYEKLRKKI